MSKGLRFLSTALVLVVLLATGSLAQADELRLYVKVYDDSDLAAQGGQLLANPGSPVSPQELAELLGRAPYATWRPVHTVPRSVLRQLREDGQRNIHSGRLPDLTTEFYVTVPGDHDAAKLTSLLREHPLVEGVYVAPDPEPAVPPNFQSNQTYLHHPADGVGATTVWSQSGATGSGITVGIIEIGMHFDHLDLPSIPHLYGWISTLWSNEEHGVASAGIIGALNDGFGTTGIAYGANLAYFAPASAPNVGDVPGAVSAATTSLSAGDVLMINVQYGAHGTHVPVEYFLGDYNAIKTAVANGIVVVLAAGNGNADLDSSPFVEGSDNHYPFIRQKDSGAIYVGAGAPPNYTQNPRSRLSFSNYGSRLDVQAHGALVFTTGFGHAYSAEGRNYYYTDNFNGTSSATPIVAGTAALVQSVYVAAHGVKGSPSAIRAALVATGVPQDLSVAGNIGPQVSATGAHFHLTVAPPDLLVRDWYCWGLGDGEWTAVTTATRYELRGTNYWGLTQIFYNGPDLETMFTVGETTDFDVRACRANPGEGCTKWSYIGGTVHYHSTCM